MHEVITLQLGNFSNYTATHFWNVQESYFTYGDQPESLVSHDVHWRAGRGVDGSETFLPRTVIYDLKGGFGALRKVNSLYDAASESTGETHALWHGSPAVHNQAAVVPSSYQQSLDAGTEPPPLTTSTVRYWSDFSRTYFHPKSSVQIYDFELHSSLRPFERFAMGAELFMSLDKELDIVDRDWRPFVEECDLMQGIQVFTTLDDAWAGFASSYLQDLRDEYPKSCIWVWGLQNPVVDTSRQARQLQLANKAQGLHQMCEQASMLVPLAMPALESMPGLRVDCSSSWHVSALTAAAAESALLPSRMKTGPARAPLSGLVDCLNTSGRQNLALAGMSLSPKGDDESDTDRDTDWSRISPDSVDHAHRRARLFGQTTTYRGSIPDEDQLDASPYVPHRQIVGHPIFRKYRTVLRFPILDSFPDLHLPAANRANLSVRTTLRTDTSIALHMKALRPHVSRPLRLDEREALNNGIAEIADAYQDDWSSGSDDDDDDV